MKMITVSEAAFDTIQRLTSELTAENERLRGWIVQYCACPCCDTMDICHPDCTFSEDCPNECEAMDKAREFLREGRVSPDDVIATSAENISAAIEAVNNMTADELSLLPGAANSGVKS